MRYYVTWLKYSIQGRIGASSHNLNALVSSVNSNIYLHPLSQVKA